MTSRKILIVEDCGDLLNLVGEALALLGWETILAESGQETMNKLELERDLPSVVLLDMRTPVIGIKLAASLKAHPNLQKYSDSCGEWAIPWTDPGALSRARL